MPTSGPDLKINELASQLSALPYVEAVILGGSISTGMVDDRSDCDLYVYTRQAIDPAAREAILRPRAARLELQRDFWEWEDTWIEHDGTKFEIMYRGCGHAEEEVERRLFRYEASVGLRPVFYTRWHTAKFQLTAMAGLTRCSAVSLERVILANSYKP
jgi:hypothetical protein